MSMPELYRCEINTFYLILGVWRMQKTSVLVTFSLHSNLFHYGAKWFVKFDGALHRDLHRCVSLSFRLCFLSWVFNIFHAVTIVLTLPVPVLGVSGTAIKYFLQSGPGFRSITELIDGLFLFADRGPVDQAECGGDDLNGFVIRYVVFASGQNIAAARIISVGG